MVIAKTLRRLAGLVLERSGLRPNPIVSEFRKRYERYLSDPNFTMSQRDQSVLRTAFVETHGDSLRWAVNKALSLNLSGSDSSAWSGSNLFPQMQASHAQLAISDLKSLGYHVLPWRMSEEWIESVYQETNPLAVTARGSKSDRQIQSDLKPQEATYWHEQGLLCTCPSLRVFCEDPAFQFISERYLGSKPVLDLIASWWTFPTNAEADSAAAQLYHFDLDRVKWLKYFVYLSDVTMDTGPHAFVAKSHRDVGKRIRRDGRFTDDEVFGMYPKSDEKVFVGKRGTVIIEDTLGFHKGCPAVSGSRFIFEFQHSLNSFGYPYDPLRWTC